jgi:hypothetical protein
MHAYAARGGAVLICAMIVHCADDANHHAKEKYAAHDRKNPAGEGGDRVSASPSAPLFEQSHGVRTINAPVAEGFL